MSPQMVHGALVHFPIAFIVGGFLLELFALLADRQWMARASLILLLLGTICGSAAIFTGQRAAEDLLLDKPLESIIETHEDMAYAATITAGIAVILKLILMAKDVKGRKAYVVPLLLAALATGFVLNGGRLGGEMVYQHGAGVKSSTGR